VNSVDPFILSITLNVNYYLQMLQIMLLLLNEQKIRYILQKIPPNHFIIGKVGSIQGSEW